MPRATKTDPSSDLIVRAVTMDASILAKFPHDSHALGPFLGKLPPEVLAVVVKKLGWFRTTFAMAGKTCREAVERAADEPERRARPLIEEYRRYFWIPKRIEPTPTIPLVCKGVDPEHRRRSIRGVVGEEGSHRVDPLVAAAAEGDIDALEWLTERLTAKSWKLTPVESHIVTSCAVEEGRIESIVWLCARGFEWGDWTCCAAAGGGHLEVLQWGRANGCPWDESTCYHAAMGGQLEVLKWLRANGCPWNEGTCYHAAKGGHLEMLKWAQDNGCPWDERTCYEAAQGGHLEVVKWLHANGCPGNEGTCYHAAMGGHLEVLKWAHQNGCPWDADTCYYMAMKGHLEMLKWAQDNGCPWNEKTRAAAAFGGHLEVLKWARANGCPWDMQTCISALSRGHTEVFQWARDNGCEWDDKYADLAGQIRVMGLAASEAGCAVM